MNSIAENLKKQRLQKNLSLDDIAAKLNIRKQYLESIEEEDYSDLPAKVYVDGYIKIYAKFLEVSLEPNNTTSIDFSQAQTLNNQPFKIHRPKIENKLPSTRLLFIFLAMLLTIMYSWYALTDLNKSKSLNNDNRYSSAQIDKPVVNFQNYFFTDLLEKASSINNIHKNSLEYFVQLFLDTESSKGLFNKYYYNKFIINYPLAYYSSKENIDYIEYKVSNSNDQNAN